MMTSQEYYYQLPYEIENQVSDCRLLGVSSYFIISDKFVIQHSVEKYG
jgi:hypothetical protein